VSLLWYLRQGIYVTTITVTTTTASCALPVSSTTQRATSAASASSPSPSPSRPPLTIADAKRKLSTAAAALPPPPSPRTRRQQKQTHVTTTGQSSRRAAAAVSTTKTAKTTAETKKMTRMAPEGAPAKDDARRLSLYSTLSAAMPRYPAEAAVPSKALSAFAGAAVQGRGGSRRSNIPSRVAAGGTSGNAAESLTMGPSRQQAQSMMLQSELSQRLMQEQQPQQQHAIASVGKIKSPPARAGENRQHLPSPPMPQPPPPLPPQPITRSGNGGRGKGESEGGSISGHDNMMQKQHPQQQNAIALVGMTEALPATEDRTRQHLQAPPPPPTRQSPPPMARLRKGSKGEGGSEGRFTFSQETSTFDSSSAVMDRDHYMEGHDDFVHEGCEPWLRRPNVDRRSFQRGDERPQPFHSLEQKQMMMTTQVASASPDLLSMTVLREPSESPIFGDSSYDKSGFDHGEVSDDHLSGIDTSVEDKKEAQGEDDGDPPPLLLGGKYTTFVAKEESECVGEIFGIEEDAGCWASCD
jgi:hypothetical protein